MHIVSPDFDSLPCMPTSVAALPIEKYVRLGPWQLHLGIRYILSILNEIVHSLYLHAGVAQGNKRIRSEILPEGKAANDYGTESKNCTNLKWPWASEF